MNPTNPNAEALRVQQYLRELDEEIARDEAAAKAKQAAAQRATTNRENAAKSTGPRTPEGKAASSKNRLAHGLCSSSLILYGENEADFLELRQQIHTTFDPATPEETLLADQLVAATWRLNRAHRVENETLNKINVGTGRNIMRFNASTNVPPTDIALATGLTEEAHQKTLACILRYVAANERAYRVALKALQGAIKRRQPQAAPTVAETAVEAAAEKPKAAAAGQTLYPEAEALTHPASATSAPVYIDRC